MISPALMAQTRERMERPSRRFRPVMATASLLVALLLMPAALSAMTGQSILGVQVTVSDMSPADWFKEGFKGWIASPGPPEFLSPEETLRIAPFPVRTPAWLPEGFKPVSEPEGYYMRTNSSGKWHEGNPPDKFGVTQTFQFKVQKEHISIHQMTRRVGPQFTWPPGTEIKTVAGHPAFLERNVPLANADEEPEDGELPPIVAHINELTLWVEETGGSITAIRVSGNVAPEVLEQVAESLFTN